MTRLLVSVTSADEALTALNAGASLIDAKDPEAGALGALPIPRVKAIVQAVAGRVPVSAALGDQPMLNLARDMAATGVDYVKTPVPDGPGADAFLAFVGKALAGTAKLVAVLAADREPDFGLVAAAAEAGFSGVMLDTADKAAGLLQAMELADVARFVAEARRNGLEVGLAGSLRVVDVGTLLPLKPDILGFRGGVCEGEQRRNPLDPARVRAVAAALMVHAARGAATV